MISVYDKPMGRKQCEAHVEVACNSLTDRLICFVQAAGRGGLVTLSLSDHTWSQPAPSTGKVHAGEVAEESCSLRLPLALCLFRPIHILTLEVLYAFHLSTQQGGSSWLFPTHLLSITKSNIDHGAAAQWFSVNSVLGQSQVWRSNWTSALQPHSQDPVCRSKTKTCHCKHVRPYPRCLSVIFLPEKHSGHIVQRKSYKSKMETNCLVSDNVK